jgi:signal transduction histidine kinase
MHPIRRLTAVAIRPHLPRRTVRLRLTAVYGGLFLASGAGLLAITYILVEHATGGIIFRGENFNAAVGAHQSPAAGSHLPTEISGSGPGALPTIPPEQAAKLAKQQHAAELHQLLLSSSMALAIMAVVSIVLGWFIAGRVLRPLRAITASVRDISANNLHERLALRGPDDELRELGDTFNGLLSRLDASFAAQRRFIANASHELRTPLARQRALAQVALADPDATADTLRVAHERVLVAGVQQERLIDALLVLARGQSGISSPEGVDLAAIAEHVIADRRPEAMSLGVTVRTRLSPAPTTGDARLVERLVANLVDNALRHNVNDGYVEITTRAHDAHVVLAIDNTGPVVPAGEVARLFQPFQRLGADRVGPGAGLGLSIVQAIAEAHDAKLHTRPRNTGGLHIEVVFARVDCVVEDALADHSFALASYR